MSAPAFQFYPKEWFISTAALGPEARGVYIQFLAWSWDNGPLPISEEGRANIGGVTVKRLKSIWLAIGRKWHRSKGGYVNPRLERQREELQSYRKKQAEKGRKSAEIRRNVNHGSTTVQPEHQPDTQPDGNREATLHSAFSDLHTASKNSKIKTQTLRHFVPEDFAHFWQRYPRRENKKAALKAWRSLEPDLETVRLIHAALDWQTKQPGWVKDRGKFVPHGASWLNGRRWEDEPFHTQPQDDDPNADAWDRVLGRAHGNR